MKKVLSLVIVAVMLLSSIVVLASCGSDSIVGEWETNLEFNKFIGDDGAAALSFLGENALDAFKDKKISISLNFKDNGKVALSFDKDSYIDFMKEIVGGWVSEEELENAIEEQNGQEVEYKFENGELTIGGTVFKADLSGNKLVLKEVVSTDEEGSTSLSSMGLPIEFTRK